MYQVKNLLVSFIHNKEEKIYGLPVYVSLIEGEWQIIR
mgnify:CR=1 FL=1